MYKKKYYLYKNHTFLKLVIGLILSQRIEDIFTDT